MKCSDYQTIQCPEFLSSYFFGIFTRKGPWVCKGIERVKFVRAIGDSQSQLNLDHKVSTQYDSIYLFLQKIAHGAYNGNISDI